MTRLLFCLALVAVPFPFDFPKDVREAFEKATEFELYSLDPAKETNDGFHGWTILGKTTVKGEQATKAREAVQKGVAESDGSKSGCFNPRHGIRIIRDAKTYDLVLCFQCLQIYIYEGEKEPGFLLTSRSPTEVLNKILADAKVPLPAK